MNPGQGWGTPQTRAVRSTECRGWRIAGRPCGNPVCSFHEADAAALLLLPFDIARLATG